MFSLIYYAIIGLVAGILAGKLMNIDKPWYVSMAVGIAGAVVGGVLAGLVGLRTIHIIGELIVATLGAILCIWLWKRYGR